MRVSREQARENRQNILRAAGRLFRERGIDAAGVDDITRAAGLTHGGFYGHFDSKQALTAEAVAHALSISSEAWRNTSDSSRPEQAFRALIGRYLSPAHRDSPGRGCPLAALGTEVARQPKTVRGSFTRGLERMFETLSGILPGPKKTEREAQAIATVATLVGSIVLARAVDDLELSDRILKATASELKTRFAARWDFLA